ncbi:TetR/AcrR family transcriptional regulator [Novosphingobium sp. BL-8A]|uniref:TetR/AcrR family transcriptional regulator n=1 Tax=Novosphingobium sp. BL-8A TaxID=3127639 RepID=UPI0037572B89
MDAAEKVFADLGYAAARLEDVAQLVGIRRPSIVYYFPGKQQLYDHIEADIFSAMHGFVEERTSGVTAPLPRLLALLDAWLDFLVSRPTAARIIQRLIADSAQGSDNPIRFSETALRDIEAVISAGIASGAFRPISAMNILNGVASGALFYVCSANLLGHARQYDPSAPSELEAFRGLMHRTAEAAVLG